MKKILFSVLVLTLTACASTQVIATFSLPTPTIPLVAPIPTEGFVMIPTMLPTEITPSATLLSDATIEVKQFLICKVDQWRDCVVTEQELEDGTYLRWLDTLSIPFDTSPISKIKDIPLIMMKDNNDIPFSIIYDWTKAPNFVDPSTAPFRKDVTTGVVWVNYNGVKAPYILHPIEYLDKSDLAHNKWVITVDSYYSQHPLTGEYVPVPNIDSIIAQNLSMWKNKMHIVPISMNSTVLLTGSDDPLVRKTFEDNPDMQKRFLDFVAGRVEALSKPGIILLTENSDGLMNR